MRFTPIILLTAVLLLSSSFCFGQNKKPFLAEIEKSKSQKIDSLVNFKLDKNKLQYLAVLPSLNYNFVDKNFNVGISLSNLSNFYQNKQRNKIELERLKLQLNEKKENDMLQLEEAFESIKDEYDILKLEIENTTLTTEIFNLKKKQYENNKITLEDWLNVQKIHQERNLVVVMKRKSLTSKMKHFEAKTKSECFKKEIEYLAN